MRERKKKTLKKKNPSPFPPCQAASPPPPPHPSRAFSSFLLFLFPLPSRPSLSSLLLGHVSHRSRLEAVQSRLHDPSPPTREPPPPPPLPTFLPPPLFPFVSLPFMCSFPPIVGSSSPYVGFAKSLGD